MRKIYALFIVLLIFVATVSAQDRYIRVKFNDATNVNYYEMKFFSGGNWVLDSGMVGNYMEDMEIWTRATSNSVSFLLMDGNYGTNAYMGNAYPDKPMEVFIDLASRATNIDSIYFLEHNHYTVVIRDMEVFTSSDNIHWKRRLHLSDPNGIPEVIQMPLTTMPDVVAPSVPQNLKVTYVDNGRAVLSWDKSTDDVSVIEYRVYKNGGTALVSKSEGAVVTGLNSNTDYTFEVKAYDGQNYSGSSNKVDVKTCPIVSDVTPPTVPTNIQIAQQPEALIVSWNPSTDNQKMNGYVVYLDGKILGVTQESSYTIPGLNPQTNYTVTVQAKDMAGNFSGLSTPVTKSTYAAASTKMKIGTNFYNAEWGKEAANMYGMHYDSIQGDNVFRNKLYDEVGMYSTFRFMAASGVHGPEGYVDQWSDRVRKDSPHQVEMAYELMIDYCNRNDANLWVNIPHKVISNDGVERGTNNYIKKLAILIKTGVDMHTIDIETSAFSDIERMTQEDFLREGGILRCAPLKSKLKVYIEYSNEIWNGGVAVFKYGTREGHELGLDPAYTGPHVFKDFNAGMRFQSWASIRLFEEFDQVYGDESPVVVDIDAYFTGGGAWQLTKNHIGVYNVPAFNPNNTLPDVFAGAPYFGHRTYDGSDTASVIWDQLRNAYHGIRMQGDWAAEQSTIIDTFSVAHNKDIGFITYEGGQCLVLNATVANQDARMYDYYIEFLDTMNNYLDEFVHFVHAAQPGTGGAWGAKEFIGQSEATAHKFRALKDWMGYTQNGSHDTILPSTPLNLVVSDEKNDGFKVAWSAASDNNTISGYAVYLNGQLHDFVTANEYIFTNLVQGESYDVIVKSKDDSDNMSLASSSVAGTPAGHYNVTVTVTDGTNIISGAQVDFAGQSLVTGANGQAVFSNVSTTFDGSKAYGSASGYINDSSSVGISCQNEAVTVQLQMATGINENYNDIAGAYPNPVSEQLVIFTDDPTKYQLYSIYDAAGNLLKQGSLAQQDRVVVNVANYAKGSYFVSLIDKEGKQVEKRIRIMKL